MKLVRGRLCYTDKQPDVIRIFTGNPVIKRDGSIVMGAGAAKQVRDHYVGIDKQFGAAIMQDANALLKFVNTVNGTIGWFKVKYHWQEDADFGLVAASVNALTAVANANPDTQFDMNMPAVGNGRLDAEDIVPLINQLPDNVTVYW